MGRVGAGIGLGEDEEIVRHRGQADPHLLAVEDVHIGLAAGGGGDGGDVGASAGLGEGVGSVALPPGLGHEPALLLLLGGPLEQPQVIEPDVDAHHDAQRGIHALQFLARQP